DFVREFGVNTVGGCCGSTAAHITAIRNAVDALTNIPKRTITPPSCHPEPVEGRELVEGREADNRPQFVASAMTAVALEQEPRPLLVGERINSQGSRKMKRLLLEDNYDEIVLVAREQVDGGAHVLDICCALTERVDEDVQMREIARKLAQSI